VEEQAEDTTTSNNGPNLALLLGIIMYHLQHNLPPDHLPQAVQDRMCLLRITFHLQCLLHNSNNSRLKLQGRAIKLTMILIISTTIIMEKRLNGKVWLQSSTCPISMLYQIPVPSTAEETPLTII